MAQTEEIVILNVQTGEAVQNMADLRSNVSILKKELENLDIGSQEYQDTLNELKLNQNALKDAMYATTGTMEDVSKSASGMSESYNSLVHRMAALKEEFRSTSDTMRRAELGQQIKEVNTKLKDLDALQGNYQRNVGNYKSALDDLSDAFMKTAGNAGSIINPLKGVTAGFKTLSSTPVIAILGVLANVIEKVIDGLKSSETNTKSVTSAMSIFGTITDGVTKVVQGLGAAIGKVVDWSTKLLDKLGLLNEAYYERQRIAEQEQVLIENQRNALYKNADTELEIAQLKQKAADKINYTHEQRIEFLKQAADKEEEIAQRAYEAAEQEYNIIKAKNALTESSTEDLNREAEAYARMVKAQTDHYNKTKEVIGQINEARTSAASEAAAARKALLAAEKNLVDQQLSLTESGSDELLRLQRKSAKIAYDIEVENAKSSIKNKRVRDETLKALAQKYHKTLENLEREHKKEILAIQRQSLQNAADIYEQGTRENLEAVRKIRRFELDTMQKEEGETEVSFQARRLAALKSYNEAVNALNELSRKEATAGLRLSIAEGAQMGEEYLAGQMRLAEANLNLMKRQTGESEEEYAIRRADAQRAYDDATKDYLDYIDEQDRLALQNRMNLLQEGSVDYLKAAIELKRYELDSLHQLEGESNDEFRARQLQAEKEYTESKKALVQQQIDNMSAMASATSDILNSLADMYEQDSENNAAAARRAKNIRTASATIDTISGAVAAFMSGVKSAPAPYGIIIGAAQAAAVTAAGMANVAKIRASNISSGSSSPSASATVSVPNISANIPQTTIVNSATQEDRLNQMAERQRVYILQSDIEAEANASRVRVAESSF